MKRLSLAVVLFVLAAPPMAPAQVGTAFTFQGRLSRAGTPTTDTCDLELRLFDALTSGSQVGTTVAKPSVSVTGGLFTVQLDFGGQFNGSKRWIEVAVQCTGDAGFTTLAPRQELTPTPHAVFSSSAAAVTGIVGVANGGTGSATQSFVDLTTAQTVAGTKTFSSPIAGSVTGSAGSVTGIVPIANGGTGSATQSFVDLTTAQTVGGDKTLTGSLALNFASSSSAGNILKGANSFIHNFGSQNTFIGVNSGNFTMTGIANTGAGMSTLSSTTTGRNNTAVGAAALLQNTTGEDNTGCGRHALGVNSTGDDNTASGASALGANSTGSGNTASGEIALVGNTTGTDNTGIGRVALGSNTTGNNNTAVGVSALAGNTTGSDNTAIGAFSSVSAENLTNAIAIGYQTSVDASNKIRLGNSSITLIEGQVAYTFSSDRNRKENLREVDAQEVLEKLRGMSVSSWNLIGHDPKQFRHYGPMAQDFFVAFGRDEVGTIGTDTTINTGDIAGILMIGLKGLDAQVQKEQSHTTAQAQRIVVLEHQVVDLERRVAEIATLKQEVARMSERLRTLSQVPAIARASDGRAQE